MSRAPLHQRMLRRVGRTRLAARLSKPVLPRLDRVAHRLSGGRLRLSSLLFPTLLLEHEGRRSGRIHHTPLAYVRDGDAFVLAATNFGQQHHPAWSTNLLAQPKVTIEVDGERIPVVAELADAETHARVWPDLVAIWPGFDDYVARSGREIRVFLLRPNPPVLLRPNPSSP